MSDAKRGYSWPQFTAGHKTNVLHGARDPERVAAVAQTIAAGLLSDPSTPDYLREPIYAGAIADWSRAEAIVRLLWLWLDQQDIESAMADLADADESEDRAYSRGDGDSEHRRTVRASTSRHVASVLRQLHRHEAHAMRSETRSA